jgi:hypothetical protein
VTDHRGPLPVPARITMALDLRGKHGPQVDVDLGGREPMVDRWEDGTLVPTRSQVERLAVYTDFPAEWFYRPADELAGTQDDPMRVFICERQRRGENGLTVAESWVDWAGVLHQRQVTPDRPAYRPAKPKPATLPLAAAVRPRAGAHVPEEDPESPGCCRLCQLPMDRPNARHRARARDSAGLREGAR